MVLVTGATGLLGSHLLLELVLHGDRVRALMRPGSDRDSVQALFRWYGPEAESAWSRIEWVQGDILDIPSLERAMEGIRQVYHCAAMISFKPAEKDTLFKTNWEGTRNLVDLCLALGIRGFCHASSIATLGGLGPVRTEADAWDPGYASDYATSKYLAEMEVWRGGQEGLHAVIVNPGVILGPGSWERGSGRLFRRTASGLRYCPPGGTGFVGVRDVVRAMLELTRAGRQGERFILVSDNLSYCDLIGRIAAHLRVAPPRKTLKAWQLELLWRLDWLRGAMGIRPRKLSRATAHSLQHRRMYSNEKIKELPGFEFSELDSVLEEACRYYLDTCPRPGQN